MSRYLKFVAGATLSALISGALHAQTTTQSVSFEVQAIDKLSASGSPSLVINTAIAGSQPTQATSSGTYAITTNETNRKITAEIDLAMPTDVTLKATLTAPSGATSTGAVTLGTSAQDAVTGITTVAASGLGIAYTLDALVTAGVVAQTSRTVTLTIIAGP